MQNKTLIPLVLFLSFFSAAQAQTTSDLFKSLAQQTLSAVVTSNAPSLTLPQKPSSLTNVARIGPTDFLIAPDVREKMGNDIAVTANQSLTNLLAQSGRFSLRTNPAAPYRFIASVSDFQGYQIEMKGKSAATAFANQFLKANIAAEQKPIDWNNDNALVFFKCTVSLGFEDTRSRNQLFASVGTYERKAILSAVRAELTALQYANNATQGQVQNVSKMSEAEIKTKTFEYAAQMALKEMLPKLDGYLLGLQMIPAAAPAQAAKTTPPVNPPVTPIVPPTPPVAPLAVTPPAAAVVPPTAAPTTEAPRPKFCSNCGNRLGTEDKFCAGCGTPVKK